MKKLFFALVLAALITAGLGSTAFAAIEVEGEAYAGGYDKYLWRGIDLSAGQPVIQGGMDLSARGVTFSIWSNVDLSGPNSDEATETDFVLDYTHELAGMLSVSIGDIHYTFGPDGGSSHELYLGFGLGTILAPSFTVHYDWDAASSAGLDGLFYTLSLGHDLEVTDALGVNLGAAINYSQESPFVANVEPSGAVFDDFSTADFSASVSFAVSDQVRVDASYLCSLVVGDDAEDVGLMDDESVAGVNVTLAF